MTSDIVCYQPTSLDQLWADAERMAKSNIVPLAYRNKPADIVVAAMWGWETAQLGVMTSLHYIDVIQGRAAYRSEGLVAVALRKGYVKDVHTAMQGTFGADDYAAICTVVKANGTTLQRGSRSLMPSAAASTARTTTPNGSIAAHRPGPGFRGA